jgi:hypothetical protein
MKLTNLKNMTKFSLNGYSSGKVVNSHLSMGNDGMAILAAADLSAIIANFAIFRYLLVFGKNNPLMSGNSPPLLEILCSIVRQNRAITVSTLFSTRSYSNTRENKKRCCL